MSGQNGLLEIKLKLYGGEVAVQLKAKFDETVADNIITSQGSDKIRKGIRKRKNQNSDLFNSAPDISPKVGITDSASVTHIATKRAELDFNHIEGTETFTETFLVSTETAENASQQEFPSHDAIIGTKSHFGKRFRERQGWKRIAPLAAEPPKNAEDAAKRQADKEKRNKERDAENKERQASYNTNGNGSKPNAGS